MRFGQTLKNKLRVLSVVAFALFFTGAHCRAASLDSAVIGMFPQDTGDLGYADLSAASQLPWFPQFEAQVVPVPLFGFEQLLESIQLRQTSPINEVAWGNVNSGETGLGATGSSAGGASELVAVMIGDFDEPTIQSYLDSRKIPFIQVGNYALYDPGTGPGTSNIFFTLLDPQTIAVGSLASLERILKVREGEENSLLENESMMDLIGEVNGDALFWGVFNKSEASRTIQRLVPEAKAFPQASDLLAKVSALAIGVKAPSDIELDLRARSDSAKDALIISQLLQAGALVRRYAAKDLDDTTTESLFDGLRITADNDFVEASLDLTDDQVIHLIERNVLVARP